MDKVWMQERIDRAFSPLFDASSKIFFNHRDKARGAIRSIEDLPMQADYSQDPDFEFVLNLKRYCVSVPTRINFLHMLLTALAKSGTTLLPRLVRSTKQNFFLPKADYDLKRWTIEQWLAYIITFVGTETIYWDERTIYFGIGGDATCKVSCDSLLNTWDFSCPFFKIYSLIPTKGIPAVVKHLTEVKRLELKASGGYGRFYKRLTKDSFLKRRLILLTKIAGTKRSVELLSGGQEVRDFYDQFYEQSVQDFNAEPKQFIHCEFQEDIKDHWDSRTSGLWEGYQHYWPAYRLRSKTVWVR